MTQDAEIYAFLLVHLEAIQNNDLDTYHATTHPDLSLYEWWVTPHRIDGLPFHDYMMVENQKRGTVFGAETDPGGKDFAPPPVSYTHLTMPTNREV